MAVDNFEKLIAKKNVVKNTDELLAAVLFMTSRAEKLHEFKRIGESVWEVEKKHQEMLLAH